MHDQGIDQTAFFLAPDITDFIRNTQKELHDEKLDDALEIPGLEWIKDEDTRTSAISCTPAHLTEKIRST